MLRGAIDEYGRQVRQTTKSHIKYALQKAGVEVGSYRWTFAHRRSLLLRDVDILADVGANAGQYVSEVRRAGWRGQIVSFEPLGEPFMRMQESLQHDRLWRGVRTAVGREAGTLDLNVAENSVFSSALTTLGRGKQVFDGMESHRVEQAPVATLDGLLGSELDRGAHIGVKVDVQGFERAVLEGAPRALRAAVFWEMELTPVELYEGQMLMVEALERLSDVGLHLVATQNIFSDAATGRSLQFNGIFARAIA